MAVVDAEQVEIVCAVAEGAAYCLLRKSDRGKEASLNHPNDNAHTTNNSNEEKEEKNCTEARAFLRLLLDCVEYYLQSDACKPTWMLDDDRNSSSSSSDALRNFLARYLLVQIQNHSPSVQQQQQQQ